MSIGDFYDYNGGALPEEKSPVLWMNRGGGFIPFHPALVGQPTISRRFTASYLAFDYNHDDRTDVLERSLGNTGLILSRVVMPDPLRSLPAHSRFLLRGPHPLETSMPMVRIDFMLTPELQPVGPGVGHWQSPYFTIDIYYGRGGATGLLKRAMDGIGSLVEM